MKYFKDPGTGQVFAFEVDGSQDAFIAPSLEPMTAEEVAAHINPPPVPPTRDEVEAARLRAYADPLTGSDRYFAEAQRESLLGNAEAAESAKLLGLARFAEIQAEYPWPAE
ncbi:tail protein [Pseudomonas phage PG1]|nr:tail protein [Pseudomonas phage PG1]